MSLRSRVERAGQASMRWAHGESSGRAPSQRRLTRFLKLRWAVSLIGIVGVASLVWNIATGDPPSTEGGRRSERLRTPTTRRPSLRSSRKCEISSSTGR